MNISSLAVDIIWLKMKMRVELFTPQEISRFACINYSAEDIEMMTRRNVSNEDLQSIAARMESYVEVNHKKEIYKNN